jgi:hypothetical protein
MNGHGVKTRKPPALGLRVACRDAVAWPLRHRHGWATHVGADGPQRPSATDCPGTIAIAQRHVENADVRLRPSAPRFATETDTENARAPDRDAPGATLAERDRGIAVEGTY